MEAKEKVEGIIKEFESYCKELGGKFGKRFRSLELIYVELICNNAKRVPDPARVVDLAKEARDIIRGEREGTIHLYFDVGEHTPQPLKGNLEIKINPHGVEHFHLGKKKGGSFAWVWEKEMTPAVRKLRSTVKVHEQERGWHFYWSDYRDFFGCDLYNYPTKWNKSDWLRLKEVLEDAKMILEWMPTGVERVAKRTFVTD